MSDRRNKINVRTKAETADFSCQTEKKKERIRQQEEEYVRDKLEKVKLDSPKKKQ